MSDTAPAATGSKPTLLARLRRRWRWLLVLGVLLWLGVSAVAVVVLTHRFRGPRPETPPTTVEGFAALETLRLTADDGMELGAWFLPGRDDRPPVALFHGYGMSRAATMFHANTARMSGCPVLLVTHRAHGDSHGSRIDFGLTTRLDVLAGVKLLEQRCPGRKPVVWGLSLGAVSALMAAEELDGRVQAYLLEAPFQSLDHAVRNRLRMYLPPGLREVAYGGMLLAALPLFPEFPRIDAEAAARRFPKSAKLLVFVGERDRHALPAESQAVVAAAGQGELLILPGAGHTTTAVVPESRAAYRAAARRFLDALGP